MKRIFAFILAFLYLSTSMGATIHLHYCMGKLKSWGLVNHETRNCDYCGMPKSNARPDNLTAINKCCSDEHKELKTEKDQKTAPGELQFQKFFPDASVVHFPSSPSYHFPDVLLGHPAIHAPPTTGKPPVYLLHCHFRI
jgi:hypothetical protein